MSYLVLARKYRPQVFEDMVGQDHLVKTLANAISGDRVAHAYLFCGPRGVGKTTAARILAKALNCEKGPAPVPCNACTTCTEITEGRSLDVLEIDGASNRGINEVRELRENVRYTPTGGRSKVYIIDEVHMLTNEAFNALLKTLEEPPPHVNFVFATTEPFKVPGTILSRCQRFDFARIPTRKIAEHLSAIARSEGIEIAPEAVNLVARRAQGGVRDALSLMDQIISAAEGAIDRPGVEQFLGLVGTDFYFELMDQVARADTANALQLLDRTYSRGVDLGDLAEGLAHHVRDLMLVRLQGDLESLIEAPESEMPRLRSQAEQFRPETLVAFLDRAAELAATVRRSEHPRLTMELALAEMAENANLIPLGELSQRLLSLEERLGGDSSGPVPAKKPSRGAGPKGKASKSTPGPVAETPKPPVGGDAVLLWAQCLEAVKEQSIRLGSTLEMAEAAGFSRDGALVLRADPPNPLLEQCLAEQETASVLKRALTGLGAKNPTVVLVTRGQTPEMATDLALEGDDQEPAPPAARSSVEKPAKRPQPGVKKDAPTDTRTVGEIFKDEPMLQKALDMFDGEMLP